jgi:hypothetical protein
MDNMMNFYKNLVMAGGFLGGKADIRRGWSECLLLTAGSTDRRNTF